MQFIIKTLNSRHECYYNTMQYRHKGRKHLLLTYCIITLNPNKVYVLLLQPTHNVHSQHNVITVISPEDFFFQMWLYILPCHFFFLILHQKAITFPVAVQVRTSPRRREAPRRRLGPTAVLWLWQFSCLFLLWYLQGLDFISTNSGMYTSPDQRFKRRRHVRYNVTRGTGRTGSEGFKYLLNRV